MHSCFTTTGNLSSLASLTQLTSVNFAYCQLIEGNINRSHESTQNNGLGHYESLMPQGNDLNAPGSFLWLTIILPPTGTGEITPELVTWLSSIKNKNLNGCGKFTLVGDMPTDTVKVDLSNMDSLEGSLDYFANCKAITSFNVHGCKKLTGNCSYCLELEPRVGPDQ